MRAAQIREQTLLFCSEKGENWRHWNNVSIYELGFTYEDFDGYYFKRDSYSIQFWGYNDFLVKVTVTDSTKGASHFNTYLITVDEKGQWGFLARPKE